MALVGIYECQDVWEAGQVSLVLQNKTSKQTNNNNKISSLTLNFQGIFHFCQLLFVLPYQKLESSD